MRAHAIVLGAFGVIAAGGSVGARPAPQATSATSTADALIDEANTLAGRAEFVGAAAKFRAAYAADPRPELICNVGVAYNKAHDLPRAQRFLAECVRRGGALDAAFMAAVRNALAGIDTSLRAGAFAPVNLVVQPEGASITVSDFGEAERLVGSQLIWLPFGPHVVTVRAEGYRTETRTLDVKDKATAPVTIQLAREVAPTRAPAAAAEPSHTPLYLGVAITGVALAAMIGTYIEAHEKIGEIDVAGDLPTYNAQVSTARTWRTGFEISAAATGVAAAITGYLWFRARPTATSEVIVAPTAGGAAAVWSGTF